jgi:hypothetical protein
VEALEALEGAAMSLLLLLLTMVGLYGLAFVTWLCYLAAMNVLPRRHALHPVAKAHAYVLVAIGLTLDFVLHVFVGTLLFLKAPQDWLLTGRLTRYVHDEGEAAWRRTAARWICKHMLDQFDPDGCHCCKGKKP